MEIFQPSYIKLYQNGILQKKAHQLWEKLHSCDICPRGCRTNRLKGEISFCKTGKKALVSNFGPHFGEEPPLVGNKGSGTIFFAWCNLDCVFCQNYDISHWGEGREVEPEQIAEMMLKLQNRGCHNINLVTPTHVIPQIIKALLIVVEKGLNIPLVYNSGGYDSVSTLKLLNGIFDIYMPDFKYWEKDNALKYSNVLDYPQVARESIVEMYRQVGDFVTDQKGIAQKGVLVRHLVLPQDIAGTEEIVRFLKEKTSPNIYLNIMDQYHPSYRANEFPEINRRITDEEYLSAVHWAEKVGMKPI